MLHHDLATQVTTMEVDPDYGGTRRYPDGLTFLESAHEVYAIQEGRPTSPRTESHWQLRLAGDGWAAEVETHSVISSEADTFSFVNSVYAVAEHGGVRETVFDQTLHDTRPRTSA